MPEDRERAERALHLYATGDFHGGDLDWPPCAARIREARQRANVSAVDAAAHSGISLPAYDDLERFDDEAFTSADLGILMSLGQLLGVSPAQLLLGGDGDGSRLSFEEISQALREYLEVHSVTVDRFGDEIGWDVSGLVENAANWRTQPVEVLYLVCTRLSIDWVAALARTA
jgi:hypothetical protein